MLNSTQGIAGLPAAINSWMMAGEDTPPRHSCPPASLAAVVSHGFHIQITPGRNALNGASQSVLVTATATADAAKTDAVKAVVTVATSSSTPRSGGGD
ncbi:MAG: hypothetical protein HZC54_07625 [Verrucomicrobia bacterium]|nr:hypothetical protein [Verrucomicrobiota bacterium]